MVTLCSRWKFKCLVKFRVLYVIAFVYHVFTFSISFGILLKTVTVQVASKGLWKFNSLKNCSKKLQKNIKKCKIKKKRKCKKNQYFSCTLIVFDWQWSLVVIRSYKWLKLTVRFVKKNKKRKSWNDNSNGGWNDGVAVELSSVENHVQHQRQQTHRRRLACAPTTSRFSWTTAKTLVCQVSTYLVDMDIFGL